MLKIKGLSRANIFLLYVLFGVLLITLNIAILPALAAPVPQNLRIIMSTAGNNNLTVSWSQSGSVTGYWISRDGQINKWATAVTGNVNYVDSGLTPGKAYVYKVASSDAIEVSPWSLKASGTTKTGGIYTKPHAPFTDNTNMCQACHSVHMSPTPYKTLYKKYSNQPGDYAVSGAGQSLPGADICFNCHDGTGAGYNVKQYYDQPTSAQVKWPGHMTRRTGTTASEVSFGGWRYIQGLPAGSRLPCMVCHDSHVSSKGNWKMLADGLVDYAKSPSGAWSNDTVAPYNILSDATNTGVIDTANNAWEKCTVCHHDGSRTNGTMRVAGLDLYWPSSTNGTPGGQLDVIDHGSKSSCACHAGNVNSQNNVHALAEGGKPSGPVDDCSLCHQDVTDRTMSSSIVSRHYIEAPTGNYDLSYPADRCTTKCHVNHGPARTPTDSFNLYTNAVSRQGAANYDFTASASQPGLCLSCHQTTQTSNRPGGTSASTPYVSAVPPQPFIDSSHSYPSTSYKTKDGKRSHVMTCLKCHRDNDQATESSRWGPHASANRSLLYLPATQLGGNAGDEEQTCFACHSPSRDQWAGRTMMTAAWRISQAFNQSPLNQGHRMFLMSQTVDRHRASEGKSFKWMPSTARHVECGDCHNPHAATDSYAQSPTVSPITNVTSSLGEGPASGVIAGALKGVWGVSVSFSGLATAANYTVAVGPPAGNYVYTASATKQWMVCLKCHSSYAYGTSAAERPLVPSGIPITFALRAQTDQVLEFNPANFGYHPVFTRGKNQPAKTLNSSNWEGAYGLNSVSYSTLYGGQANVSGLTSAFVPPWGAASLVTCADCHSHQSSSYSRNFYTTASNAAYDWPRGPHGSSKRWMLKGLDRSIRYRRNNNTTFSYAYPLNAGTAESATHSNTNNNIFCLNCHRADVYGYLQSNNSFIAGNLARVRHGDMDAGRGDPWKTLGPNALGIICNYCHMGGTRGGAHGTSRAAMGGANYPAPMGRRMLNGAVWVGYNAPNAGGSINCAYRSTTPEGDTVSACNSRNQDRSGDAAQVNYTYTGMP